ncbi:MAG TPA: hypothetical protein VFH26_09750 [Gemmatimonadales bacterium]|nr:hypothetical protein [Gemmatimonadales bacterium]
MTGALVPLALAVGAPLSTIQAQEILRFHDDRIYSTPQSEHTAARVPHIQLGDTIHPRTYWLEVGLITGGVFAFLGASLGSMACDPDSGGFSKPCWDDIVLGGVTGFGVGGSLGALIGGLFKKPEKKSDREQPTNDELSRTGPRNDIGSFGVGRPVSHDPQYDP